MIEEVTQTASTSFGDGWPDRCRYWAAQVEVTPKRTRRERRTEPVVLSGHGLSIRVDKGCLIVKGGNTHYPAKPIEHRFFKGGLDIPPRIVLVDGSGNITLDALDWISEQGIALIRIGFDGRNAIAFSPTGYAADQKRVAWQLETRDHPKKQLAFGKSLVADKLKASIVTLEEYLPDTPTRVKALAAAQSGLSDIRAASNISVLLSMEGRAARAYWSVWRDVTISWKAQSRYPVPDQWRTYTSRASLLSGKKWKNWRASHPINAMLNYAYASLLTEMRVKAIAEGYDPMIGVYHDQRHYDKDRTPSFALDLMEPMRPVVDRAVLRLIAEGTFSGADFVPQSDGVCRLNPELARNVASVAYGAIHD
jgi:CRISPR-associated protein Cas1